MRLVYKIIDKLDGNDHELEVYEVEEDVFHVVERAYSKRNVESVEVWSTTERDDVDQVIRDWQG